MNKIGITPQSAGGNFQFNRFKGGLMEALFLDVVWPGGMPRNFALFKSHTTGYSVRPDGVAPAVAVESTIGPMGMPSPRKITPFSSSVFLEVKAVKGSYSTSMKKRVIRNTRQIKGMIHALSQMRQSGTRAATVSAATLMIVAFSGVDIHENVIKEAKNKHVNLYVIRPEYNEETGEFRFTEPEALNVNRKILYPGNNGLETTLTPAKLNGWSKNKRTTSFEKIFSNPMQSLTIPATNEDGSDGDSTDGG